MSISEAIARVRRGATRSSSSLLDGALSYLGVRLKADLSARLKSDSVPHSLRPLATRLASLIKLSDPPLYDDSARQQLEVVSLDRALVRAAQQQRASQPATSQPATSQAATAQPATSQPATSQPATSQPATAQPAASQPAHPAGDVCPFTGLRADGSLAEAPAAAPSDAPRPAASEELASATRLPIPTAANDASSVVPTASAADGDLAPAQASASGEVAKPKKPAPKRAGEAATKPANEKRKEKLAGPQDVTNTSARSTPRPAKQSGGKGQTSSRKRRDSGL